LGDFLLQLSAAEEDTHEEGIESGDTDELPFAATTTSIFSYTHDQKQKKQKKYNLRLSPTHSSTITDFSETLDDCCCCC
jgi:hypothetical protein